MDLKSLREDVLKIETQEGLADLLGIDVSVIRQLEETPNDSKLDTALPIVMKIHDKTGLTLDDILGWKKAKKKALEVKNTWEKADFTKKTFLEYLQGIMDNSNLSEELKKSYLSDLKLVIERNIVKPKIAIVGHSDTGKSTLINSLLGNDQMPTAWTPTTSIAVYIKHITDRPAFIHENAWVFANQLGEENAWDETKLNDEEYCQTWKIAAGDVDILRTYGIRQGTEHDKEAGSAVVFVDSPILNTCDIVDLPGYGTERESDNTITFGLAPKAEIIIYLSQANAFMRGDDFNHLKQLISSLPIREKKEENSLSPLGNLFVVASQAQNVNHGNRQELNIILDKGCERLLETMPEGFWSSREDISGYTYENNGAEILRARFFTYTTDIPDLCTAFNESITAMVETLPILIEERSRSLIREYVNEKQPQLNNQIAHYDGLINEREKYVSLLNEIKANEENRVSENDRHKEEILKAIKESRYKSKSEFSQYISNVINADVLIAQLKNSKIKNRKEDIDLFVSKLQTSLQKECERILNRESSEISRKAENYIAAFSENVKKPFTKGNIATSYDAGWAFASALSSLGMIGGLGALAYGAISGAVLMAGISGAAGIAVGLAGGMLALTPVFGPVGLACGVAIAGAMGIVKLFGGGWEKSVAKKIVEQFEKDQYLDKFLANIDVFWDSTENAFHKASDAMESEWEAYVENLETTIHSYNSDDLEQKLSQLKDLSDFFENIPL